MIDIRRDSVLGNPGRIGYSHEADGRNVGNSIDPVGQSSQEFFKAHVCIFRVCLYNILNEYGVSVKLVSIVRALIE